MRRARSAEHAVRSNSDGRLYIADDELATPLGGLAHLLLDPAAAGRVLRSLVAACASAAPGRVLHGREGPFVSKAGKDASSGTDRGGN